MRYIVLSLLICLLALPAFAQSKRAKHFTGGTWTAPTARSALEVIRSGDGNIDSAVTVLRQTFNKHYASELDAFVNELAKLFLEGNFAQSSAAARALRIVANRYGEGTPYAGSPEIFIRMYDQIKGADVILAMRALSRAFNSNGEALVRNLFHNSPKPKQACNRSMLAIKNDGTKVDPKTLCPYDHDPWCAAGKILARNSMRDSPRVPALSTDPTPDDIFPFCYGQVREGDKWPLIRF